jgi:glycerophosphoryl diester phosphodiesterase
MGRVQSDRDEIRVIGHRGAAGLMPENTLAGFEHAIALGVDAVECDVHTTRDGHVVVIHDETVDRTTNGTGRVAEMTLSQLAVLDAGDGRPVPLLSQLLDLLAGRCELWCELKADGTEDPAAEAVVSRGLQSGVTFISFDLQRLSRLRRRRDDLRIGALMAAPTARAVKKALDLGVSHIGIHDRYATAGIIRRIRQAGVSAGVWTPNTLARMQAMIRIGATHITTDRPDILLKHLGRLARDWGPCGAKPFGGQI